MKKSVIENPIRPGFYPDPSIIGYDDAYYMVNSSFLYFPCIPISKSYDLVNWETVGHAITNPEYIDFSIYSQGRGIWAPDISYSKSNSKFYIVATLRGDDDMDLTHRQVVVYADKPEGPYSAPVFIDEKGIDPSLFHDDDGKHYMLFNTSVKILPLTDDCLKAAGPVRILFDGCTKVKTEGPHILKKDGYYYIIMAEGGTGDGHMITCARARSLDGPFEECPHNPLLTQTDTTAPLQRTGHGKFFVGPDGEWYTTYLCSRKHGGKFSLLGRETAIAKVSWDKNGWPIINEGNGPLEKIEVNYPVSKAPSSDFVWDFSKVFSKDIITYEGLYLKRQTEIDFTVKLNLLLPESSAFSSCHTPYGLIFYYDMNSYIKFGVFDNRICILVKNTDISDTEQEVYSSNDLLTYANINVASPAVISLIVETNELTRSFYLEVCETSEAKKNENKRHYLYKISDCSFLCDEGVTSPRRFVGPTYGVFGLEDNEDNLISLISQAL